MNNFLILVFLFFMGCTIGWVLEVFFRRFYYKNNYGRGEWVNPGFLAGPYLPVYGFGLCTLYILAGLERFSFFNNLYLDRIVLFLVMAICMTIIEFIAGKIFIIGMKVQLWDYSDEKFNYKGIICLRFSFFWAVLGAIYYFLIHPYILDALEWFSKNLTFSFILGIFFGVFIIDVFYSLQLSSKIRTFATEYDVIIRYEELKSNIRSSMEEQKKKYKFLFPFLSEVSIREHLVRYMQLREAFSEESISKKITKKLKR